MMTLPRIRGSSEELVNRDEKPADKSAPPSQSAKDEANHAHVDHRLTGAAQQLIVLAEPALLALPSERSFDDPATVPTGRFVSVMVSILSGSHSHCAGLSSDGDV